MSGISIHKPQQTQLLNEIRQIKQPDYMDVMSGSPQIVLIVLSNLVLSGLK